MSHRGRRLSRWHGRRSSSRSGRFHGGRSYRTRLRRSGSGGRPHPCRLYSSIFRFFFRLCCGFRLSFGFRDPLNRFANFFRDIDRNRARMRFLFRDAESGQKINDGLGLDLQLAGQLVDSDLICVGHSSFGLFRLCLFRLFRFTLIFRRRNFARRFLGGRSCSFLRAFFLFRCSRFAFASTPLLLRKLRSCI